MCSPISLKYVKDFRFYIHNCFESAGWIRSFSGDSYFFKDYCGIYDCLEENVGKIGNQLCKYLGHDVYETMRNLARKLEI